MRVNEQGRPTRATLFERDLQMARLGGRPRDSRRETEPPVEAVQQVVEIVEPSPRSQFVQGLKRISEAVVRALRSAIKGR